jgi:hypothetical protein
MESNILHLLVTFDPKTMQLEVNGNIMRNKITALGMLELAKKVVIDFEVKKEEIIVPEIILPPGIGRS